MRRRIGWRVVWGVATATALVGSLPGVATASRRGARTPDQGWVLSVADPAQDSAPTFVGNGYFAQRIPAEGTGYATAPVETQSQVAGLYAQGPGGTERRVSVPTWSTFGFSDGSGTFGNLPVCAAGPTCAAGDGNATGATQAASNFRDGRTRWTNYRQTLDLRRGVLTTSFTWTSPAGRATDLMYRVIADQARAHVASVRLSMTPHWTGTATVIDMLDGSGSRQTTASAQSFDPTARQIRETVTTEGTGITAVLVSRLQVDGSSAASVVAPTNGAPESMAQQAELSVEAAKTYSVTKYVGIATSVDTDGSARRGVAKVAQEASATAAATGWTALLREHESKWASLWRSDVSVRGDLALTLQIRASLFYLLASTRAGVNWSLSPGGLSSDGYNGHVFWDAETWMYPALLSTHPDIAVGVDAYRQERLAAAKQYAVASGRAGARVPWESALTGSEQAPPPWGTNEQHITADVVLAQWQYYEATGDKQWLKTKGWPVIEAGADFWVSRATPDPSGGYDIDNVMPPDEEHLDVDNSVYTNVAAATALRIATRAAHVVGTSADPRWTAVADGIKIPFDAASGTHPEFDGYRGDTVKQADVVMLQYPWQYAIPHRVAQADLDYYIPRVDVNGPSMTDAIRLIDTAALGSPGCASYTFLRRSVDPFIRAPFAQFAETRTGGAFTFVTGIGGFLQEFLYGFTGFRWSTDHVELDPMLPPQIPGLSVNGMYWQGRRFDVIINGKTTKITLTSGKSMPIEIAGGHRRTLHTGRAVTVPTHRPDLDHSADVARCRSVTVSSADRASPAVGAVDGSPATGWRAGAPGASLTVDLGSTRHVTKVIVRSDSGRTTPFDLSVSGDGRAWHQVAAVPAGANPTADVTVPSIAARWVRYTAAPAVLPGITDFQILEAPG